jgi:exosortase N
MEALVTRTSSAISKEKIFLALMISIPIVVGGAFAFPLSYLTNSNELVGVCLLPFVLTIQKNNKRFNYLFLLLLLLFACGAWMYNVRMFYFFSLAFYILWFLELLVGAVNRLTIFLIGFMSPFFFQISVILGFPIRLQLSQMVGTLLQWVGVNVQIEGNMMLLNGATFIVDEACMGLNMMAHFHAHGNFYTLTYESHREKNAEVEIPDRFLRNRFFAEYHHQPFSNHSSCPL